MKHTNLCPECGKSVRAGFTYRHHHIRKDGTVVFAGISHDGRMHLLTKGAGAFSFMRSKQV